MNRKCVYFVANHVNPFGAAKTAFGRTSRAPAKSNYSPNSRNCKTVSMNCSALVFPHCSLRRIHRPRRRPSGRRHCRSRCSLTRTSAPWSSKRSVSLSVSGSTRERMNVFRALPFQKCQINAQSNGQPFHAK